MDSGSMQTAYRFTAAGRQFAAPFAQRSSEIITNTQHTRSTLSHLQSFVTRLQAETLSVGDLMIAAKLSGEIIGDFNEIIEEIVEQRRALIASVNREIEAAKQAGDNFSNSWKSASSRICSCVLTGIRWSATAMKSWTCWM